MDPLGLEAAEKTFHHRIIQTIALMTRSSNYDKSGLRANKQYQMFKCLEPKNAPLETHPTNLDSRFPLQALRLAGITTSGLQVRC